MGRNGPVKTLDAEGNVVGIQRFRRGKSEMGALRVALREELEQVRPATARMLFYILVSRGLLEKTESEYDNTLVRLLVEERMRWFEATNGNPDLDTDAPGIPFSWVVDNGRGIDEPWTADGIDDAVSQLSRFYRRKLWTGRPTVPMIMCEKDAQAGVIREITARWDTPLLVTRGYASLTFLKDIADRIIEDERHVHIYYFGDLDATGLDIPRDANDKLRLFTLGQKTFEFERVAVNPQHIALHGLLTRPGKPRDPRAGQYKGPCVELDALHPNTLRDMVEKCILEHMGEGFRAAMESVEAEEARQLEVVADKGVARWKW